MNEWVDDIDLDAAASKATDWWRFLASWSKSFISFYLQIYILIILGFIPIIVQYHNLCACEPGNLWYPAISSIESVLANELRSMLVHRDCHEKEGYTFSSLNKPLITAGGIPVWQMDLDQWFSEPSCHLAIIWMKWHIHIFFWCDTGNGVTWYPPLGKLVVYLEIEYNIEFCYKSLM